MQTNPLSPDLTMNPTVEQQLLLFRALIENSSDIIVISDEQGIERYVSPSVRNVLGYEPAEWLSHSQSDLHHPDDRTRIRTTFFDFVGKQNQHPIVFDWRFRHKNGTYRHIEATASNQLQNPVVRGIILNMRDVTERKLFEEALQVAKEKAEADARSIERQNLEIMAKNRELKKLNEEKNELMQIVSHDLKNPLFNIQSEADSLLVDSAEATAHARRILQCTDKMLRLITNFLSIHAIESGRMLLHFEPVDMRMKVQKVLNAYAEPLKAKELTVETQFPETPVTVWVDAGATYQLVDNLLSNAIKYSPPGRTIHLELSTDEAGVLLRVRDEGPGIPLNEIDRLFQKFTTLSTRPTAGESSSGLGLAIARKLARLLHGDIWYEHRSGQPGATFVIQLPLQSSIYAKTPA